MCEYINKDQVKSLKKSVLKEHVKAKGKILVMDEEAGIRHLLSRQLSRIGYDFEVCDDGAAAIEMYKKGMKSGDLFDVVILDLTHSSGMGGVETIRKLLTIDLEVKGIVSTGYPYDPAAINFKTYGFCGALIKPYNMVELENILSEIIAGDPYIKKDQALKL